MGREALLGTCLTLSLSSLPTATTVSSCPALAGSPHRSPAGALAVGTEPRPLAINSARAACPLAGCREVGGAGQSPGRQPSRTST